jgi:ABC-type nitrate/sulfonate/bicarbonate transport system substrate-binding protein
VTTRSFIKRDEDAVRRFVKAMVEGIHYYKTHKVQSMEVMARYMRNTDRKVMEVGYDFNAEEYERKPYASIQGIQLALEEIAHRNPKAKEVKVEQFLDARFVRELDQNGFIDRLYK